MKRAITLSFCGLIVGAIVYATVPNTFNLNEKLSSAKINANFSSLDTRVSTLEAPAKVIITRNGKKWSLGAVTCGGTGATGGQITNGYAGAKVLCESACGSASAHMCTPEEMGGACNWASRPVADG